MFTYPKQAEINRVVPKTKIYAHVKLSKRLKELFVSQVAEIIWKYKLSPETTNLPARDGINEIEVFDIIQKTPDLDNDVLGAINKAIPFPLLFQLVYNDSIRFATSYKRLSEADGAKWVIEASFRTATQTLDVERPELPVALDLASLYEQTVRRHIPLAPRKGEKLGEQIARFNALEAKTKMRCQLLSNLAHEKQFNRKVELNTALRSLAKELEVLAHP